MTEQDRQNLEALAKSIFGVSLKKFLDEKYYELNQVSTIKTWDEALGRQEAVKILKELFSFMEETKVPNRIKPKYN